MYLLSPNTIFGAERFQLYNHRKKIIVYKCFINTLYKSTHCTLYIIIIFEEQIYHFISKTYIQTMIENNEA